MTGHNALSIEQFHSYNIWMEIKIYFTNISARVVFFQLLRKCNMEINISIHVIPTIGYIRNLQWLALQLAWLDLERSGSIPVKPEFIQVLFQPLRFFMQLRGSFPLWIHIFIRSSKYESFHLLPFIIFSVCFFKVLSRKDNSYVILLLREKMLCLCTLCLVLTLARPVYMEVGDPR